LITAVSSVHIAVYVARHARQAVEKGNRMRQLMDLSRSFVVLIGG